MISLGSFYALTVHVDFLHVHGQSHRYLNQGFIKKPIMIRDNSVYSSISSGVIFHALGPHTDYLYMGVFFLF